MAETNGLVQRISIVSDSLTCVWIGPTPNNTEALIVSNDGTSLNSAFASSLVLLLSTASTNYHQVVAVHGDSDAKITSARLEPI